MTRDSGHRPLLTVASIARQIGLYSEKAQRQTYGRKGIRQIIDFLDCKGWASVYTIRREQTRSTMDAEEI